MTTNPIVAHTDNYDVRVYEQNGKYCVGTTVNNGNIGAGIKVFDTIEEANAYLKSLGVDESVFFDNAEEGIPGGVYSNTMGDVAQFATKYSLLNVLTNGAYSEKAGELAEHAARYSLPNAVEHVEDIPGSAYTDAVGNTARVMTQYSLLNVLTNGAYSEGVGKVAENVSKFSLINLISNLFS